MRSARVLAWLSLAFLTGGWLEVVGYLAAGDVLAAFRDPAFGILVHLFQAGTAVSFVSLVQAALQKRDIPLAVLALLANAACLTAPFVWLFLALAR